MLLSIFMILGIAVLFPQRVVHADAGTREAAVKWVYEQEGKFLDYDKAYGAQCVDLIKYYYAYFGKAGYAKGNGCNYVSNKLPDGWTRIKNTASFVPEPGDIAVWNNRKINRISIYPFFIIIYCDMGTVISYSKINSPQTMSICLNATG